MWAQCFDIIAGAANIGIDLAWNSIWIGTVLVLSCWLVTRFVRNLTTANRYNIWFSVLLIIVALPLMAGIAGKVTLSDLSTLWQSNSASMVAELDDTLPQTSNETNAINENKMTTTAGPKTELHHETNREPDRASRTTAGSTEKEPVNYWSLANTLLPIYALIVWVGVALFLLARLLHGYLELNNIKKNAIPFDPRIDRYFQSLVRKMQVRRKVYLCQSSEISMPMAAGYFSSRVIIPRGLVPQLTNSELQDLLLHELAHIKRYDDVGKLFQRIFEAIFFFNPIIRVVGHQLAFEREIACDDAVVRMTKRPQDYARCLTRLVEITSGPRFALAPGAILSRKQLFRRFDMILNSSRNTFGRVSRLMLASSLAIIITIGAACLMISPAIAFSPGGMTYFELSQMLDERLGSTPDTPEKAIEIAPVGESVDEPLAENTDSQPIRTEKSVTIDAAAKPEPITLDPKTTKSPVDVLIDQGEGDFHLSSGFAGIGTDSHGDFRYVRHNHQKGGYEDAIRQFERSVSGVFSGNVINDHDGGYTYYHNKGRRKIIIDIDGDYEISDDLKSIKPKGNGSSIIIEERLRSKSTELYLALDRHGREELEYYIDGDSAEYDQDAKEWLANLLLFAATNSGVWTDKHVALLLKEGGVDEVLQTVESFDSDYIKRMYYQEMLIQAKVNDEQLDRILGSVEREIDSDHEKAELLIVLAREYDVDRLQSKEFVDAVSSLDSDYEMRRVLGEMAFDDSVSPEVILEVLDLAGKMGSDYERAELLLDLADVSRKEPKTRKAYYKAVEEMGSDYETRRVLTALGFDENIDDDELRELLVITSHLSSDYEKATVLSDLIDPIEHHPDLHLKWLDAISDIDSDYEMANLLTSFIRQVDMGDSVTLETIRMADRISSDYEKARMLKRLEKHIGDNAELEAAFNDAVESIDSDYEREQFSRGKRRSGSGSY